VKEWVCRFSSPQEAARAVAELGGALSYFSWQRDGVLSVRAAPGKEALVQRALEKKANNPNDGIIH